MKLLSLIAIASCSVSALRLPLFDMERDGLPSQVAAPLHSNHLFNRAAPNPVPARISATSDDETECSSNAECIKKRLPILPQKSKKTKRNTLRPRASACVTQLFTGTIRTYNASTGADLGNVKNTISTMGGYGAYSKVASQALVVSFYACPNVYTTQLDLTIKASQQYAGRPYFGAAYQDDRVGNMDRDMADGSGQSVVLTGVGTLSGPGQYGNRGGNLQSDVKKTPPTTISETSIWNYDPVSGQLTLTWVNSDLSTYDTPFHYYPVSTGLNADKGISRGMEQPGVTTPVKLIFVPQ